LGVIVKEHSNMQTQELDYQSAIDTLALTGKLVDRVIEQIPPSQWLQRPAPHSTHVLWIVGHVATTRGLLVRLLGSGLETKPNPLFAGGSPLQANGVYPSSSAVADLWREMGDRFDETLKTVSLGDLQRPSPEGVPTFNGRVSGVLAASVFHEAYHVGQLGYLMRWLGHSPLLGR
jgi:hypothetical protein